MLMLVGAVAMTGCSYHFHNKDYSDELGAILTDDVYKDLSVSVDITNDQEALLNAYLGSDANKEAYIDETINTALRTMNYKDDSEQTVGFMGTVKNGAAAKNDDVTIIYYIFVDGKEITNIDGNIIAYKLGTGKLLGNNFDTKIIDAALSKCGSTEIQPSDTKVTASSIADGYNILYVNIKATHDDGNGTTVNYGGYNKTFRIDMNKIDLSTKAMKPEYADFYDDELLSVLFGIMEDNAGELTIGDTYSKVISCDIAGTSTDVTFEGKIEKAQKETYETVTVDFESTHSVSDLAGKTGVEVKVMITSILEYSLNADFTSWFDGMYSTTAKMADKDKSYEEKFKIMLTSLRSDFTSEATTQSELVTDFRKFMFDFDYKEIETQIIADAKEAMLNKLVTAAAGLAEDQYPGRAVKQCYKEKINNHKYTYNAHYTSAYSTFEEYLTKTYSVADYDDALAAVMKESRLVVLEKMVIMYTANRLGIEITSKEYKENADRLKEQYYSIWYFYKSYGYTDAKDVIEYLGGKENIYISMYYNRVMEKLYNDTYSGIEDITKNVTSE